MVETRTADWLRYSQISQPEWDDAITKQLEAGSGVDPILMFFRFGHLPDHLKGRSRPFADMAVHLVETLPRNPERTVALRKLLEAKDAAVRAAL